MRVAPAAFPMSIPEPIPPTRRVGRAMAWGVAIGVRAVGLRELGRRQWVRFNIRIFRQMFEPLESLQQLIPGSLILSFGQKGISRYLGLMLGLLARRVLGQYDPALLGREPVETSSLILVEPNVQAW